VFASTSDWYFFARVEVGKLLGVGNTVKLFDALANGSKEDQFLSDGGATGSCVICIYALLYIKTIYFSDANFS
jgi:hypothetical protein